MFNFFRVLFSPVIAILDFITKYFKTIVFLTILYFVVFDSSDAINEKANASSNLQKIELFGPILDVSKTLDTIQKAKNDNNIKGVLLDVNSPGGSVAPSIELSYAIKELSEIKPVVVYASGVIASGSYYASIWANKIIANPGSMVGSIGVIMQGVNVEELMKNIGISTQTVKAGKYKESGTPTRKWFDYEEEQLQSVINDTYKMFVNDVSNARKLNPEEHNKFADARIFTATQAKDVGLIDEVATLTYAKENLIKLAKVKNPVWKKQDKFEKFIDKLISETVSQVSINFSNGLKAY